MKLAVFLACASTLFLIKDVLSIDGDLPQKMYSSKRQNVCRKLAYYFSGAKNKNECWYNPNVDSYAHDIIRRYGYTFESYKVTSSDGYITTLFRIPRGKDGDSSIDRQPVLLQHGIAASSHVMVDIGKEALAFVLADAGYDVWLGNLRGSAFSLGHKNMTYKNKDYWHFSFHEMGKYDLPSSLQFISKLTGDKQIIFIGHSIAASVLHVFEALHRQLAKKLIKVAVLLSPLVYLENLQPPPNFEQFDNPLVVLATLLGVKSTSESSKEIVAQRLTLCNRTAPMLRACNNGMYLTFGLESINIPPHYIPLMLAHNPSGFSINTFNHLIQIAHNDGTFQNYDYGVEKNQQLYGDVFPLEYDVMGCEVPIIIFYGENDWISTEKDIERLVSTLPEGIVKEQFKINSPKWSHMDYFYGKYLTKLFIKPLLSSIKKFKGVNKPQEIRNFKADSSADSAPVAMSESGQAAAEAVTPASTVKTTEVSAKVRPPVHVPTPTRVAIKPTPRTTKRKRLEILSEPDQ